MVRKVRVTDTVLIMLILVAGAILRFWRLWEIPFTYDEFSALFRTQFATFGELIEKGVKIDTHPAGVQVFLFYLVKASGISEAAVKTPFIIFGLLSVWFVYLIGKDWFNATVGLVAASFVSFLQFPVMYSQIARPYASGLCFCLLMVWFWTKVIFHPGRKYYLNLSGYMLTGAICFYNHHFSLLFAAMVAVTGLFYCTSEKRRSYLISCAMIGILYIPHLPIFFTQLGMGGVEGWLHKPRYDFMVDFIQYIFQFSVFVYLLVLLLVSLELYWYDGVDKKSRKFILISVIWFIIPYLVGFLYSRYRNAVLQYSVLIFSFPVLFFIIFGYFSTLKAHAKIILVSLIALVVIPSLVAERQHYALFYRSPYQEIITESKHAADSLGPYNCTVILDTKKEINDWYLKKLDYRNLQFTDFKTIRGRREFMALLDHAKSNYLAFGCIAASGPINYPLILSTYPYLAQHKTYAGGDFYLFTKIKPVKARDEYFYSAVNTFEQNFTEWGYVNNRQCTDSLALDGEKSYDARAGQEFSPTYFVPLRPLLRDENDVVDVSVDMRLPMVFPAAWLVVSVTSKEKIIYWDSTPVNDFISPGQTGRVFHSLRLSDIDLRHHGLTLRAFIWNPAKLPYIMDNFTLKVRRGNKVVYGLYRKVGL